MADIDRRSSLEALNEILADGQPAVHTRRESRAAGREIIFSGYMPLRPLSRRADFSFRPARGIP